MGHLAERQSVFGHADLLAATLAREPGAVTVEAAKRATASIERGGSYHAARGSAGDDTTGGAPGSAGSPVHRRRIGPVRGAGGGVGSGAPAGAGGLHVGRGDGCRRPMPRRGSGREAAGLPTQLRKKH